MCGIYFELSTSKVPSDALAEDGDILPRLKERGPDWQQLRRISLEDNTLYAHSYATVLSLRGPTVAKQPLEQVPSPRNSRFYQGFQLYWNGEAWKIHGSPVVGNDTKVVLDLLVRASQNDFESKRSPHHVLAAISRISGPYAFVFVDGLNGMIYFGRDPLGRRSLLVKNTPDTFIICSVSSQRQSTDWNEVEPGAIEFVNFGPMIPDSLDRRTQNGESNDQWSALRQVTQTLNRASLSNSNQVVANRLSCGEVKTSKLNRTLPSSNAPFLGVGSAVVLKLETLLRASLQLRVENISLGPGRESALNLAPSSSTHLAVLFSGGLDCTVLARLVHDILPTTINIDLLNVAFENPRIHKATPALFKNGDTPDLSCYDACPDRITARASCEELRRECPERQWTLVEIDIPYWETQSHRSKVKALMFPHNTDMDLSIAFALYFASRGIGQTFDAEKKHFVPYTSSARILLSGLGADELFGGYQRHVTAFERHGYDALLDEIELDVGRLGKRNLGRDDRVLSCWGRETRFPYLDEDVVEWAVQAPIWEKCGFIKHENSVEVLDGNDTNDGFSNSAETKESDSAKCDETISASAAKVSPVLRPDKLVLRLLAFKLGMENVANEKKRAIQFGARTAKMESGKTKGTSLVT